MTGKLPNFDYESACRDRYTVVCGIDEAGRGPLAGPVVAGAVVLPRDFTDEILTDSKKLSEKKREQLYERLTTSMNIDWCIALATVEEIDEFNILRATHLAMRRAAEGLKQRPGYCLIDGLPVPGFPLPSEGIVKGDAKSLSIAAASIIAKVGRDRMMVKLDSEYPGYGFAKHKGYGTKQHCKAIVEQGPCAAHRKSFAPIRQMMLDLK